MAKKATQRVNLTAPPTLADSVFQELRDSIVRGHFQPGEKLREGELATQFGTSRGPLRDALRRLESQRLVTNTPNAGARVVSLSGEQLIELYHVREALEGMTCRLAADNMSEADIAELADLLLEHEREIAQQGGSEYFNQEGDLDFHFRIALGCGNDMLRQALCEDHYWLMRLYRQKYSSRFGRPAKALSEHRLILDAIADRDGELAELLMRRHIRRARKAFEQRIRAIREDEQ